MSNRIDKKALINLVSERVGKDTGTVGEILEATLEEIYQAMKQGESVSLRDLGTFYVRPDPHSARPLLNLPWEYLHDGHDFLALNWRTPLSRLPWGLPSQSLPHTDAS